MELSEGPTLLPPEILSRIVRITDADRDSRSLAVLRLVSRDFDDLASSLLFATFAPTSKRHLDALACVFGGWKKAAEDLKRGEVVDDLQRWRRRAASRWEEGLVRDVNLQAAEDFLEDTLQTLDLVCPLLIERFYSAGFDDVGIGAYVGHCGRLRSLGIDMSLLDRRWDIVGRLEELELFGYYGEPISEDTAALERLLACADLSRLRTLKVPTPVSDSILAGILTDALIAKIHGVRHLRLASLAPTQFATLAHSSPCLESAVVSRRIFADPENHGTLLRKPNLVSAVRWPTLIERDLADPTMIKCMQGLRQLRVNREVESPASAEKARGPLRDFFARGLLEHVLLVNQSGDPLDDCTWNLDYIPIMLKSNPQLKFLRIPFPLPPQTDSEETPDILAHTRSFLGTLRVYSKALETLVLSYPTSRVTVDHLFSLVKCWAITSHHLLPVLKQIIVVPDGHNDDRGVLYLERDTLEGRAIRLPDSPFFVLRSERRGMKECWWDAARMIFCEYGSAGVQNGLSS